MAANYKHPNKRKDRKKMAKGKGIREVGYIDCAGGGQVVVKGNIAYIGNMSPPASASFSTAMICSSLNRFFFTSVSPILADSTSAPYYFRGARHSRSRRLLQLSSVHKIRL